MTSTLSVSKIQGLSTAAAPTTVEIASGHKLTGAAGAMAIAGGIVNATQFTNATTFASTSTNDDIFDETITPKLSGSKFLILFECKLSKTTNNSLYLQLGIDNVYSLYGRDDTNPSATCSWYLESYGSSHLSNASYQAYIGNYLYSHTGSNTWNLKVRTRSQGGTVYLNYAYSYDDSARGRPISTCTVLEIAQ